MKIPHELFMRADDVGEVDPPPIWYAKEAEHVISLIDSGSSIYNDNPVTAKGIRRECCDFIAKYVRKK